MDPVAIRSRFIQENLRKALHSGDRFFAWVTAHEFGRYFQWFRDSFPEEDRHAIAEQLSRLEQVYGDHRQ